jgi:hypothetical protein
MASFLSGFNNKSTADEAPSISTANRTDLQTNRLLVECDAFGRSSTSTVTSKPIALLRSCLDSLQTHCGGRYRW